MAGKTIRMSQAKQILMLRAKGESRKRIARILGVSKTTVKLFFNRIDGLLSSGHSMAGLLGLSDPELEGKLYAGNPSYKENDRYEDLKERFSYYQGELKRTGVTRQLLWEEYIAAHPGGYSYSQFCYHLQQIAKTARPTMHLEHKPGDKLYIDFAGKTLAYIDPQSGEQITCQVFVACLPYSDYGFALAVEDQSVGSLLYALGRCLAEHGGVPASIERIT